MATQNETSSLHALRELRESDKRRQREAEQARAQAEQERQAQARQERLARENAERQAAEAYERAQSTRLGRELDVARTEIAHLRGRLEQAYQTRSEAALPSVSRARTFGWLGISAGATMLVGALALWAAMQPPAKSSTLAEMTPPPAVLCPQPAPVIPVALAPQPLPPTASPGPSPGKRTPKSRPPRPPRPHASPVPTPVCDGTDPLCGLPSGLSDDRGKPRGRRDR